MIRRVALSGDFLDETGAPAFPMFDLNPLKELDGVELIVLDRVNEIRADQLRDVDALILLQPKISAASLAGNDRLAVVARFGVGYDSVDVAACTERGILVAGAGVEPEAQVAAGDAPRTLDQVTHGVENAGRERHGEHEGEDEHGRGQAHDEGPSALDLDGEFVGLQELLHRERSQALAEAILQR